MRRYLVLAMVLALLMGVVGCGSLGLDDQIKSWKDAVKTRFRHP